MAQHEAYNVLRKYGVINESARGARAHANVGRSDYTPPEPHSLTQDEIIALAEACVAILETRGQSVDVTLSEISAEAGGFLLPEDVPRVREEANLLLCAGGGGEDDVLSGSVSSDACAREPGPAQDPRARGCAAARVPGGASAGGGR